MTILTRQQLMEQRNLTASFVRKHDRDLGGRGKPRRYDLDVVDAFLRRYFREEQTVREITERNVEKLVRDIDVYIASARGTSTRIGEMTGKGGRGQTCA